MIEISNRHFDTLIDKLPRILEMARDQVPTLRQSEDIRQLLLLHRQLLKKKMSNLKNIKS